jgi:hypothetical protein
VAVVSKPVIGTLCFVSVLALLYYFQSDDTPTVAAKTKVVKKETKKNDAAPDFLPEDFVKRFERGKPPTRNIFKAAAPDKKHSTTDANLDHVPSEMAGGDGNWIFTGVVVLDGSKMALLENSTSHQGSYVSEGQSWKASHIVRISPDGVALVPKAGGDELVVYRHKASVVADTTPPPPPVGPILPPAGPIQPLNPQQLNGPIGGNMIIRRGRRRVIQMAGSD